jgi:hypothetical protein
MAYGNITYNGITLEVQTLVPTRKQKTKKSVIGKSLVEANIIGLGAQQWELRINGVITSDLDATRTALEASDDCQSHSYNDGLRSGSFFIVPNSLQFDDDAEDVGNIIRYGMVLIEE